MYRLVKEGAPPIPDDISDTLKDFLQSCFKKILKSGYPLGSYLIILSFYKSVLINS